MSESAILRKYVKSRTILVTVESRELDEKEKSFIAFLCQKQGASSTLFNDVKYVILVAKKE